MFELTVRIKDSEQTLNRKFLVYDENVQLNHDNPKLKECVESTLKDFKGNPNDIDVQVRIKMEW